MYGLNEQYMNLSKLNKEYLRDGRLDAYADNLRKMAEILCKEGRIKDEIKCLLISFYIDISGWNGKSKIIWRTIESISCYIVSGDMDMENIKSIYDATIKKDILPSAIAIINLEEGFEILRKSMRLYCRKNSLL